MERIINGLPIRRNSIKPSTLQRNLTLEILQKKLLIGKITPINYLIRLYPNSQLEFQTLDYSPFPVIANDSEAETESHSDGEISSHSINTNENEANPRTCRVCLLHNADTIILPCRHAQICYSCAERLAFTDGAKHCPICMGIVEQYFKFFL